ncbi:MAG: HypC/HybG/HupF family hydrogenase formation chaperone [Candidatus Kariarchaeaceae archaeon]|jgi:hydrogenase expression/formation protein HypC
MCLSVVAKLEKLHGDGKATVVLGNVRKTIELGLIQDALVGDWVLVHTGFAIAKIDEQRAQEILAAYELIVDQIDR